MELRCTQYFLYTRERPDRKEINDDWIVFVMNNPIRKVVQTDKRIRYWAKIQEANGRYLRVVVLEDGVTVHNAFFDRTFKE